MKEQPVSNKILLWLRKQSKKDTDTHRGKIFTKEILREQKQTQIKETWEENGK